MQNDVLANTGKRERMQMASDGENVEEIVAYDEPDVLVTLIDNGYAKEYYELWKTHEHGTIRYALALQGYYPETLNRTTKIGCKTANLAYENSSQKPIQNIFHYYHAKQIGN